MSAPVLGFLRTQGVLYELEELETTIGRGAECDLVLEGHGISTLHAKLSFQQGGAQPRLVDLRSVNGTFVNGIRLQANCAHDLGDGDIIQFSAHEKRTYLFDTPKRESGVTVPDAVDALKPECPGQAQPDRAAGLPRQANRPPDRQFGSAKPEVRAPAQHDTPSSVPIQPRPTTPPRAASPPQRTVTTPPRGEQRTRRPDTQDGGHQREPRFDDQYHRGGDRAPWDRRSNPKVPFEAVPNFHGGHNGPAVNILPVHVPIPMMQPAIHGMPLHPDAMNPFPMHYGPPHVPPLPMQHAAVPLQRIHDVGYPPHPRPQSWVPPSAHGVAAVPEPLSPGTARTVLEPNNAGVSGALAERVGRLEERVAHMKQAASITDSAPRPPRPTAQHSQADRGSENKDATSLACGALALQRVVDRLTMFNAKLRRLQHVAAGRQAASRKATDVLDSQDESNSPEPLVDRLGNAPGFFEQLCDVCQRLERVTAQCENTTFEIQRALQSPVSPAVLADRDKDKELQTLKSSCESLRATLAEVQAERALLEQEVESQDTAGTLRLDADCIEEGITELKRHLALYGTALGGSESQGGSDAGTDRGESEPCGSEAGSAMEKGSVASVRSLARGTALSREESSTVLAALLSAQQRINKLESRNLGSRRWFALEDEVKRLRDEDARQSVRVQRLRRENGDMVQGVERDITELREKVKGATGNPESSLDAEPVTSGEDFSSQCAALLLEQLEALEDEKTKFQAKLAEAAADAAQAQRLGQAEQRRADLAKKMYADAEEAADRSEELKRRGTDQREALLNRVNLMVRKQIRGAEEKAASLRSQLADSAEVAGALAATSGKQVSKVKSSRGRRPPPVEAA